MNLRRLLRSTLRTLRLGLLLCGALLRLLSSRSSTRAQRAESLHRIARHALRTLQIPVTLVGRFPDRGAVISNHTGYLDIVALAALHPVVFISKAEVRRMPLVGWISNRVGTVYVERGSGGSAERARREIEDAASHGVPIAFFPEGTTSDGEGLLPFRSGILSEMIAARVPVTPAAIRLQLAPGNGPDVSVRNDVRYWDDRNLFLHIFRLLGLRGISISVELGDSPIAFTASPDDRKLAAEQARAAVMQLWIRNQPPPQQVDPPAT